MVPPVFRLCVMPVLALFVLATLAGAAPHDQQYPRAAQTPTATSTDLLSNPTTCPDPITVTQTATTTIEATVAITKFNTTTYTTTATVAITKFNTTTYTTTATVATTDFDTITYTTTATVKMTDVSTTTTTVIFTSVATVSPTPACPTGNRVANPGFEIIGSSWILGNANLEMVRTMSGNIPDAHVLSSSFTAPGQINTFYQVLSSLCPGRTYRFQAEIQMWVGAGTGKVLCYFGQTRIFESAEMSVGPWVTISANVVPKAAADVLRCDVISGGATGARRFVLDDFVFELSTSA